MSRDVRYLCRRRKGRWTLALERRGMRAEAYELDEFVRGDTVAIGPSTAETGPLPWLSSRRRIEYYRFCSRRSRSRFIERQLSG